MENRIEAKVEKTVAKNFPKLMKDIKIMGSRIRIKDKFTTRHSIHKLLKIKHTKKYLNTSQRKYQVTSKGPLTQYLKNIYK